MKRFAACMFLVAVMSLAGLAAAQDKAPAPDGVKHGHKGMVTMLESLNLTPKQKHEVALILKDNREQAKPLREAMKTAFMGLHEVMDKTPGDEAAVRAAAKAVAKAGEELAVNRGQMKAKIDAVLTPEQKAKRDQMKAGMKDKFKDRMEKRHHEMDAWIEQNSK